MEGLVMEASFTPDGAYVLAGTAGGEVVVWSVAGRREVARLGGHATVVGCVKWNPKYAMMASACQNVVFWTFPADEPAPRVG